LHVEQDGIAAALDRLHVRRRLGRIDQVGHLGLDRIPRRRLGSRLGIDRYRRRRVIALQDV
jgi:hypothetical protein